MQMQSDNKNVAQVVFFGIDGMDPRILNELADKTIFLKMLKEEGAFLRLKTAIPTISPAAWTSMFTGCIPEQHNIFDFVNPRKGSIIMENDLKAPLLWDILWFYGGKYCVIGNISFFANRIMFDNGVIIPASHFFVRKHYEELDGLFSDKQFSHLKKNTVKEIKELLRELYFVSKSIHTGKPTPRLYFDRWKALHYIFRSVLLKIRLAALLFTLDKWKFFALILNESDVIQHYFFDRKDVLEKFFIFLDKALYKLYKFMERNGNISHIFIASDHGFHKVPNLAISITTILEMLNKRASARNIKRTLIEYFADYGRRIIYSAPIIKYIGMRMLGKANILSRFFKKKLSGRIGKRKNNYLTTFRIDPHGYMYIHEKRREAREYVIALANYLKKLYVSRTRVFTEVHPKILSNNEFLILFRLSGKFNIYARSFYRHKLVLYNIPTNRGCHHSGPPGIFIVYTKDRNINKQIKNKIKEVPIWAVAPTILAALDIPIPDYMLKNATNTNLEELLTKINKNYKLRKVKTPQLMKKIIKTKQKIRKLRKPS